MIVEMATVAQAGAVAQATAGQHLAAKEEGKLSRRVDLGPDFEVHRAAVEAISVLFKLYDDEGNQVPSGWMVTGAKFQVEWPENRGLVSSHFGARRYGFNWALGQVKADMDAKGQDRGHDSVGWDPASLRKQWNRAKAEVAPWWAQNSKEAYSSGIADLCVALKNWKASKAGTRKGKKVGFPRFCSKRDDHGRVRFSTGAMRFEPDRRTIVLPVVGALRSKENTRRVERHLATGNARLLSLTLSEQWGRLFVSANYAVRTSSPRPVTKPGIRAGVDLGLRTLATVVGTDGTIRESDNPAPLRATMADRRRTSRKLSRRIPGSRGHEQAKAKLAKLDRRAVHLRREAWHQLTSWLGATYCEVVIEDLDVAAMKKSMGRRAFRRAVSDAALGMFAPMLAYKAQRSGTIITVADRWSPSSKLHHGCGCTLIAPTKLAKRLICQVTGGPVDRDINAAKNLRDYKGPVRAEAPVVSSPTIRGGGAGPGVVKDQHRESGCKTRASRPAVRSEAGTKTPQGDAA